MKNFRSKSSLQSSLCILSLILGSACSHGGSEGEWPSYNRTIGSDRYAPQTSINASNVKNLKVLCQYDTKDTFAFQSGLIQVESAIFGTTDTDSFSINPETCVENWRAHEDFKGAKGNRGLAYLDGKVFRGTPGGSVIAYDAESGQKLWTTNLSDDAKGEAIKAAPIAFEGRIYVGNVGGDAKGGKGQVFALDAATGRIDWHFFLVPQNLKDVPKGSLGDSPSRLSGVWKNDKNLLVGGGGTWTSMTIDAKSRTLIIPGGNPAPEFVQGAYPGESLMQSSVTLLDTITGAYKKHFPLVLQDFHDWDVSSAPALVETKSGKSLLAVTPKNGMLYRIDLVAGNLLTEKAMTRIENVDAPVTAEGVRFCPGMLGGASWNGPAFDKENNLIFTGQVDWCATARLDPDFKAEKGEIWAGSKGIKIDLDDKAKSGGFVVASNADTGDKIWTHRTDFPVVAALTPTAAQILFAGDLGGNFFALDSKSGKRLWSTEVDGAIGAGIISYDAGKGQRIAVATGMSSPLWTDKKASAKILIYGLK